MTSSGLSVRKFVFAGNRFFVLKKMLELELPVVKVLAVESSYLERELNRRGIAYERLVGERQLVETLRATKFDFFIANGCPFILPISQLEREGSKRFINVHPSFLPELRGADPVPGALLHGRTSGATCHVMSDEIDAGDIIAQTAIDMTDCLDCGLLYQLSFIAEQEVFVEAHSRGFEPKTRQERKESHTYYTIKERDLEIDFSKDYGTIVRTIRAFSTRARGAFFVSDGKKICVRDVEIVTNPFLLARISNYGDNEVVFNYEGRLLIRKDDRYLKLKQLDGDTSSIDPGDVLGPTPVNRSAG